MTLPAKPKYELIVAAAAFAILCVIALATETTGDGGDSITHYLFSRYAFRYPGFFLHHWAKPVFVLLSAPFAQFGFSGIEIFNCLCATLSALFAFYTARQLKIGQPWLAFVFLFFTPFYFQMVFSGLTEYLFALATIAGIYFTSREKHVPALLIISFLPLMRSEGLLIMGVFVMYYLVNRKFKYLPLLLAGQFLYSIAGARYHGNFWWVFSKIPYATWDSPYGQGELFSFVHKLNAVIEIPLYFLLVAGIMSLVFQLFKSRFRTFGDVKTMLVLGTFLVFFVAHSIFWWKGIFFSMGLQRVLISVVPQVWILALIGLQAITGLFSSSRIKYIVTGAVALAVAVLPFTERPGGVIYNKHMFRLPENRLVQQEVAPFVKEEFPAYSEGLVYYSHPNLSIFLDIDPWDPAKHKEMRELMGDTIPPGSLVIWDEWYAVDSGKVPLEQLTQDSRFRLVKTFEKQLPYRLIKFAVFEVMPY